jgi:phosphotriesterase-related protein
MATVNSVLGPCDPKDLGFTLIHEHLSAGFPGFEFDNTSFDRKAEVAKAVDKLKEIKTLGVSTFVDPCPMELGRDVEFAAEVAEKSGVRIVMATGLYNEALGIPPHFRSLSPDAIAEVYVRELTEGIGKTGIKAGIIKTATGGIPGMTETATSIGKHEETCLRAAARTQKATGAPILCHNDELGPFGRETLDIFADEGVDFNRVLIGHACGVGDMRYYFDILERGAWIGFDRFGVETIASDKMRLASLIGLLAVGYDRIMLSHDHVSCWLGRVSPNWQAFMDKCPNWSYSHICRNILPALNKAGVSEGTIRTMTVDNPRNYFGG